MYTSIMNLHNQKHSHLNEIGAVYEHDPEIVSIYIPTLQGYSVVNEMYKYNLSVLAQSDGPLTT